MIIGIIFGVTGASAVIAVAIYLYFHPTFGSGFETV
jgi:hypothetical protein